MLIREEMCEKHILRCYEQYENIALFDNLDKANTYLSDDLYQRIDEISFDELCYIFKNVLIRYFCKNSISLCDAAERLQMKRTTLAEFRRRKKWDLTLHRPARLY